MPAEWYYTSNKQQMGPVSWEELQQLATSGLLKPQDLVWTDGMGDWVKASKQAGLFGESEPVPSGKRSRRDEDRPRRSRRYDDDDDDEEDEREVRRRKARQKEGMAVGLKIGLAIGGGVFLLLLLFCGGLWLFVGGGDTGTGPVSYSCSVDVGDATERVVFLKGGKQVTITVTATSPAPRTDVDLHVYDPGVDPRAPGRPMPRAADESIGLNSRVVFTPPQDGNYTVQVRNVVQNPQNLADRRSRGRATCQVLITR